MHGGDAEVALRRHRVEEGAGEGLRGGDEADELARANQGQAVAQGEPPLVVDDLAERALGPVEDVGLTAGAAARDVELRERRELVEERQAGRVEAVQLVALDVLADGIEIPVVMKSTAIESCKIRSAHPRAHLLERRLHMRGDCA